MKASVAFVSGLVVGAAGGVIFGATYMKNKIEEVIEERVDEEVKNFIDDYFARKEEDDEPEEESDISESETYNSLHENLKQNYHKPDPSKIFRDPLMEHPEEPEEESDILEESPVKKPKEDDEMKEPRLISEDKFDDGDDTYSKETLYFYQDDDVLTDEDEHELDNELEYLGNTLDKFGFRDNDEQLIHVRNEEKKTDYEVIKVFAAFRD